MWGWWIASALAGAPEGVDVLAVEAWQERAIRLRRGPEACWRLEGRARNHVAVYRSGGLFGRPSQSDYVYEGPFVGILDHGKWTRFETTMEPASEAATSGADSDNWGVDWSIDVRPLVGTSVDLEPEAEDSDAAERGTNRAVSLVDGILDAIDADVTSTWAGWSDERSAVELTERYPLGDSKKFVELVTRFPEGRAVGSALDVTFPQRHRVPVEGSPVRITLLRPQAHIRTQMVDGEALPVYESISLAAGVFGFTVGYEQTLTYTKATACTPSAP